jgi:L-ascorbate oxidase
MIQLESRERSSFIRSYAVLNYGPPVNSSSTTQFYPPESPPITLPATDTDFLEYKLNPHPSAKYSPDKMPTAAEVTRRVNITVHLSEPGGSLIYLQNGYTWNEQIVDEPYLVSLYNNEGHNFPDRRRALLNNGLDPFTYAYPAAIGEVLEIVVQNTGSAGGTTETHPWHAHGSHYWDLGSGPGVYNSAANEAKWANSTGKPVLREYDLNLRPSTVLSLHL